MNWKESFAPTYDDGYERAWRAIEFVVRNADVLMKSLSLSLPAPQLVMGFVKASVLESIWMCMTRIRMTEFQVRLRETRVEIDELGNQKNIK